MAKRKPKPDESPRERGLRLAFAMLRENGIDGSLIVIPTTGDDRAGGVHLPIVRWDGDMSQAYGMLCLAYEHAEECGLTPPDEEDAA